MTQIVLTSIFSGVGGSLILAAFFTLFLALDKVIAILPLFIAFNGALIGFRLVERLKDRIQNIPLFSAVLGAGGGAATFVLINAAGAAWSNPFSLSIGELIIYIIISGVTSYLGATLAAKYFNL